MKVKTKVWINDDHGRVIFGAGRVRILQAIERLGSMSKAAKELHMSYRALWGRIESTEERIGAKILIRKPGGGKESGSVLTSTGRNLLENYRLLSQRLIQLADREFENIFGKTGKNEE